MFHMRKQKALQREHHRVRIDECKPVVKLGYLELLRVLIRQENCHLG
jgi:hypothetical protein